MLGSPIPISIDPPPGRVAHAGDFRSVDAYLSSQAVGAGSLSELEGWARKVLDSAPVARLGFVDNDDHPRVLPVTFALVEGCAWSAIDRKPKPAGREPARLRFLRRRPAAALTADHYEEDWSRLAWVQLLGQVSQHEAASAPAVLEALRNKYAPYRDQPPPGPLLRLEPTRILTWRASEER
jgi:PPOX class probable F420-dependent enzyme